MVNITVTIVYTFCFAFNLWYALRYNTHMLQLNGYKTKEHFGWLKKNILRQRFFIVYAICFAISLVLVLLNAHVLLFLIPVVLTVLPAFGYSLLKTVNTKKKLVFTKRVKRLIAAFLVLNAIIAVVSYLFSARVFYCAAQLLLFAVPYTLTLTNLLMKPVEKAVANSFINDAKKKLKENRKLTIIGITGSYGKTSLKFYLKSLLSVKYSVCATPESFNTPMGVVRTIRENLKSTDEIFLCEMGARHVGDIKEICDIVHPHHGLITSVGPQHLETFFTIDNVRHTKFELADALPKDGKLFLNADSEEILKDEREFNRIWYSVDSKTGYYADAVTLSPLGTDFTIHAPNGESETFHTKLIGNINVLNLTGAIAVAHSFGIPLRDLVIPVRRINAVPHRLELKEAGSVTVIDDAFNSNPVGSKAAVETLKCFPGTRILITPGMVELGAKEDELHYKFGTYAAACCDYIFLVNPYRTGEIKRGAIESGFPIDRLKEFDKFTEAYNAAVSLDSEEHKYILIENDLPDNY